MIENTRNRKRQEGYKKEIRRRNIFYDDDRKPRDNGCSNLFRRKEIVMAYETLFCVAKKVV